MLASSTLECQVYAGRKLGNDDFVGGIKDMVEALLAQGAAGGPHLFSPNIVH